jgi:hypothetical protein
MSQVPQPPMGAPALPPNLAPVAPPVAAPQPLPPNVAPQGVSPLAAQLGVNPGDVTGPTAPPMAGPPITGPVEPAAGATDEAPKKRNRKPRAIYRAADAAKLEAVPADWNAKDHLPLSKDDFANEALFFDFKAAQSEKAAANWKQLAADVRAGKTGDQKKNLDKFAKALKLLKEMEPMLRASLGDAEFERMAAAAAQQPVADAAGVAAGV